MATILSGDRIAEILRISDLAWLLPNVRQDFIIWNSLNDTQFYDKFIQAKPAGTPHTPEDFAPSNLALIALGQYPLAGHGTKNALEVVDSQVIQMAIRRASDQAMLNSDRASLEDAGLLALAMAYNHQVTASWSGLLASIPQTINKTWLAAIACLYGLADHPAGLLNALVQPATSAGRYMLAIHALLSNPLPPSEQIAILTGLCYGPHGDLLPASDRIRLLGELRQQRPQAAVDFSNRWLNDHAETLDLSDQNPSHIIDKLESNNEAQFTFDICKLANDASHLTASIQAEHRLSQDLCTEFISLPVRHASGNLPGEPGAAGLRLDINQACQLYQLASRPDHDSTSRARMALSLYQQGLLDEAKQLLPYQADPPPDDADTLYALAWIASNEKDQPRAGLAAARIMEIFRKDPASMALAVWGEGLCLMNLGSLLLHLDRPADATQVFELALQTCPNDAGLLNMLAACYQASHAPQQAAETYQALVSLAPTDLDYRRHFARALEELGDWEASLNQRSIILKSSSPDDESAPIEDIYAYSRCALEAGHAGQAFEACNALLVKDPEDYQALIYAGEARLSLGEAGKGIEVLTKATQVIPGRPDAWLALAKAQKSLHPTQVVIETLKNASQSVPDCAQIFFALGDLYLQDNAPSLALPELQCAVELAPEEPEILFSYGQALQVLGHNQEARTAFSQSYEINPALPGLAQLYSKILIDSGAIEEAIAPLELLINTKTGCEISTYLEYARCILAMNQRDAGDYPPMKALIALNEVMQIDPEHAEAKALTAEALAQSGENELAFQAYREALDTRLTEKKEWFERLSYGFGCVASAIGKHDVAIAALQEAGQANPDNQAIFKAQSDVYLAAGLPEDAMHAASNVLVINENNPDSLAWFAKQAKKVINTSAPDSSSASSNYLKQVSSEALNAMHQAIQLAPTRTDLLLQLGDLHAVLKQQDEAKTIFASIAGFDFASIDELKRASRYASNLGDHESAIACLEKAASLDEMNSDHPDASIYNALARQYVRKQDHASAISTLDRAIQLMPTEDSVVALKVEILLGLGQSAEALRCIETAVQEDSGRRPNVDLVFLASQINRSKGDFPAALHYAGMGAALACGESPTHGSSKLTAKYRIYVAELYRALLQPEQAYRILTQDEYPDPIDPSDEQAYLDYLCLSTELALETGEQPAAQILETAADVSNPAYTRLVAIKARVLHRAGDHDQAAQLFRSSLQIANHPDQSAGPENWDRPYQDYLGLVSRLETCLDLGLWDEAQSLSQQLVELAPAEPLPYLSMAKLILTQAENYQLCTICEVTRHKPLSDLITPENYTLCTQYLDKAESLLEAQHADEILAEYVTSKNQIYRWQARMNVIFNREGAGIPDPYEILSRQHTPDDAAALISYLQRPSPAADDNGWLNRIIKLARLHPQDPKVTLQVALALQDNNTLDALKSLQSVLELNASSSSPTIALCNLLSARLAYDLEQYDVALGAVEAAISYWQDEPRWHAFAARIYQSSEEADAAIKHLITASQLEPKELSYHLDLGRLYLAQADDDPHLLSQALASFEHACTLDAENVPALFNLASTQYRLHDLKNAEQNARKALLLVPDRADIYQLLSEIAIGNNDFQSAYEYANKALAIDPKDLGSGVALARSLAALGRQEQALAKLDGMIAKNPEVKDLKLERVGVLWKKDGPQAALDELIALANAYPDDFEILNVLSKSYLEFGETQTAVSVAQRALTSCTEGTSRNEQANLHLLIGKVLRQSGQLHPSIQHLNAAIQLAPDRLEPYLELGLACKERREYQQALQIFEQAALIAPNDPRAVFQAGLAFKESKDYKSSETMLRRAVSLAPNDLNIRRQLAAVVALNLVHNPRLGRN